MIQFAKDNIDDMVTIRFLEMDATKMPFDDNEFDIVLSFGIMHHNRRLGEGVGGSKSGFKAARGFCFR